MYDNEGKRLITSILKMANYEFAKRVKESPDWFIEIVRERFENDAMVKKLSSEDKKLYKEVMQVIILAQKKRIW